MPPSLGGGHTTEVTLLPLPVYQCQVYCLSFSQFHIVHVDVLLHCHQHSPSQVAFSVSSHTIFASSLLNIYIFPWLGCHETNYVWLIVPQEVISF